MSAQFLQQTEVPGANPATSHDGGETTMKTLAVVVLIGLVGVLAAAVPGDARDNRPHGGVVVTPSVTFGFGAADPYPYPTYAYPYPGPYWYPYASPPSYYSPYAYAPPSYCPSVVLPEPGRVHVSLPRLDAGSVAWSTNENRGPGRYGPGLAYYAARSTRRTSSFTGTASAVGTTAGAC